MFGAKYSRLKFWLISIPLFIITTVFMGLGRNVTQLLGPFILNVDGTSGLNLIVLAGIIIWLNTLANRIRDYGSNPWIALFSLIPLVNIGLALYYGVVKHKKESSDNTMSNNSKSESIEENVSTTAMNRGNDDKIYEQVSPRQENNTVKVTTKPTLSNTTNKQISDADDKLYEQALLEIEEDKKVKSAWAKALAQSDGDRDKAVSIYIKHRVSILGKSSDDENETDWDKRYAKMQQEVKDSRKSLDTSVQTKVNIDDDIEKKYTELDVFFYPNNYTEAEKKKILGDKYDEKESVYPI